MDADHGFDVPGDVIATHSGVFVNGRLARSWILPAPIRVCPGEVLRVTYNQAGEPIHAEAIPDPETFPETHGSAGGKARAAKLTRQERSDIASKAARARWHKGDAPQ